MQTIRSASAINLGITVVSKAALLFFAVYIARLLSTDAYSDSVKLALIVSLLPLLQFGIMNGAAIVLPRSAGVRSGKRAEMYWDYNSISVPLQTIAVVALFVFDYQVATTRILMWLALNCILAKFIENARLYLGANLAFSEQIKIRLLDEIGRPVIQFLFFFLSPTLESVFIAQFVSSALTCAYLAIWNNDCVRFSFSGNFAANIKGIWIIGLIVFVVWSCDLLFRSIDRWFVATFYPSETLASYGFASNVALNIWLAATSFLTPSAQALFAAIGIEDFRGAHEIMRRALRQLIVLLVGGVGAAVVVYPWLTGELVGKYQDSFGAFLAQAAFASFLSLGNLYIYYLTATRNSWFLIRHQLAILAGVAMLDVWIVGSSGPVVLIACASAAGMLLYMARIMSKVKQDLQARGVGPEHVG